MGNRELFVAMLERRIDKLLATRRRMVRNVRSYHQSGRRPTAPELAETRRHFRILSGQLRIAQRELTQLQRRN